MSLRLPGPVAQRALADALANVGVHEVGGNNEGPSVHVYQQSTVPPTPEGSAWCACFVCFRLRTAAHTLGVALPDDFCRSGYVPDWVNWAKHHGVWIPAADYLDARPGDLICYDWTSSGECHHIGFLVGRGSVSLATVEGNTSPGANDPVARDGDGTRLDGVYKKQRTVGVMGSGGGFIRVAL